MKPVGKLLGRLFLALVAVSAAGWASRFLFNPDEAVQLNRTANGILSGASFRHYPLAGAIPYLAAAESRPTCDPSEIRAAAIVRLRLYDSAIDLADVKLARERLLTLRGSVKDALSCVPTDGLLWFIAYWSALNQGGTVSEHLAELRMSYALSPFEGWIALRSPYVLAIYDTLPEDLKENARNEFVAIVATGLIRDAVRILKGSGWRFRDELTPGLAKVRLDLRLRLAKALRAEDLAVEIPGVEPREFRPWR